MYTESELLRKKRQIEDEKQQAAELQGELKALEKQLKDQWGFSSLKEAKQRIQEIEQSIVAIDEEIEETCMLLDEMEVGDE